GVDLGGGKITLDLLRSVFNETTTESKRCMSFNQSANDKIFTALCKALNLQGADALNVMPPPVSPSETAQRFTWPDLAINQQQAQMLFDDVAATTLDWLVSRWKVDTKSTNPMSQFNLFSKLPPEAQTILFDLHYVGLLYRQARTIPNDPKLTLIESQSA